MATPRTSLGLITVLALGLLLAKPAELRADYSLPPFADLVLGADAIVVGAIAATGSPMTVRVDEWVAGAGGARIQVAPFQDWTCSARWTPYANGQKVMMFLKRGDGGVYSIMSAGGEGEMPMVGGRVVVHSYYSGALGLGDGGPVEVAPGVNYGGATVDVATLATAIRAVRSCFRVTRRGRWRIRAVRHTCGGASIGPDWSGAVVAALRRAMR